MPGKKYNSVELWKAFLESGAMEVTAWLRENHYLAIDEPLSNNKPLATSVLGFADKKKKIIERAIANYEVEYQDKLTTDWGKVAKNCTAGEMKILNDFALAIHSGEVPKGTKALERVFKMFRLALGKSTNINQNKNENNNIPVSEEDVQAIADIVKKHNEHYNRSGVEANDTEEHTD